MGLRLFKMPQDAKTIVEIIPQAFQYPDHPEWSVDTEDEDNLIEMMQSIQKIWWLISKIGWVWKPAKDLFLGFVWEEDGQAVGLCNVLRQGGSQQWLIGNVAVLPTYRRRGIARKLVQACVDLAIERGAKQIILDVIDKNVPAYELYKDMGFTHYAERFVYEYTESTHKDLPFPSEYATNELKVKDWHFRYELAQRITPRQVQEFEPVTEAKYKTPRIIGIIQPIIMHLMRIKAQRVMVENINGQVVGIASHQSRKNGKGTPHISITLDKTHAQISQPLIQKLMRDIRVISPTATIELVLPDWQYVENEIDPILAGFHKKMTHHRLGMQV